MSAKTTRVGVGWKKQTPDGKRTFLSIVITNPVGQDFHYSVWQTDEKRGESSPDYVVTKSADERPAAKPATQSQTDEFPGGGADSDVPF